MLVNLNFVKPMMIEPCENLVVQFQIKFSHELAKGSLAGHALFQIENLANHLIMPK